MIKLGEDVLCVMCECCDVEPKTSDIGVEEDDFVPIEPFEDGHYEFDVVGFGQDDLSTTVTDEYLTCEFQNDRGEELSFVLELPKNVIDININISKGIMSMALVFKPCNINVNFV